MAEEGAGNSGRFTSALNAARNATGTVRQGVADAGSRAGSAVQGAGHAVADGTGAAYQSLGGKFNNLKEFVSVDVVAFKDAGWGAVGAMYEEKKKAAQRNLFDLGGPVRAKVMFGLLCATKTAATSDPDMFDCVKRRLGDLIEVFWSDLTVFVEQMMEDTKDATLGKRATDLDELANFGSKPMCLSPRWWRAQVLYHLRPFDQSAFAQLKDPIFWILTVVSLVNIFGIRVAFFAFVLLLIMTGCPADEYQLVSYILGFKGTQFISSGLIAGLVAAVKYYLCVLPNGTHTCDKTGPGANQPLSSGVSDFLGSCVLTWIAFCCLPCSERNAGRREVVDADESEDLQLEERQKGCCGSQDSKKARGGRLRHLLIYDLICFVLSCLVFCLLLYVDAKGLRPGTPKSEIPAAGVPLDFQMWQIEVAVFWARLFYSLLSWPFFFFFIPGLQSILTHTTATGYNRNGACVPCMLKEMPEEDKKQE